MTAPSAPARSFLFLQGPASPAFARLGAALAEAGHGVRRVNFCGGDRAVWAAGIGAGAVDFREAAAAWPDFLAHEMARCGTTDIVLFGDRRPLHAAAAAVAEARGAAIWSFDEGYLRPDWITLERGGNNGRSPLPRDPKEIRARAARLPEAAAPRQVSAGALGLMAARQAAYELANLAQRSRFPHWRTHRPQTALVEMRGWLRRVPALPLRRAAARAVVQAAVAAELGPFFLFPLQVDSDFQIRAHSGFRSVAIALHAVLASFAAQAPRGTALLVKNHPLDNGLLDCGRLTAAIAAELGIGDRVHFIDGGHLPTLLAHAAGVVTVNSTVGLAALLRGRPVKALGRAIYNLPGLTSDASLDAFWRAPPPPDMALVQAFRRVVVAEAQINGSFHTAEGIPLAVAGAMSRLLAGTEEERMRPALRAPASAEALAA